MGKHSAVHGKRKKIVLCVHLFPVNIKDIGKILKGKERNSDRQGKLRMRDRKSKQASCEVQEKAGVFEKSQNQQIHHNGKNQIAFTAFGGGRKPFHLQSHVIIEKTGEQEERNVYRITPCIKNQASCKQHRILETCRHHIIDKQKQGQKTKYEKNTIFNS